MRHFMNLLKESATPELPPVLYHGTTPYNAALIVLSGHIEANESRDDDDHDNMSVCTTERSDVAEWFYDVVRAVDQPFGFVFHIDTSKIKDHMRPFEAETAGKPEYEWRVYGAEEARLPARLLTAQQMIGSFGRMVAVASGRVLGVRHVLEGGLEKVGREDARDTLNGGDQRGYSRGLVFVFVGEADDLCFVVQVAEEFDIRVVIVGVALVKAIATIVGVAVVFVFFRVDDVVALGQFGHVSH